MRTLIAKEAESGHYLALTADPQHELGHNGRLPPASSAPWIKNWMMANRKRALFWLAAKQLASKARNTKLKAGRTVPSFGALKDNISGCEGICYLSLRAKITSAMRK
jgi:hypothetical protein